MENQVPEKLTTLEKAFPTLMPQVGWFQGRLTKANHTVKDMIDKMVASTEIPPEIAYPNRRDTIDYDACLNFLSQFGWATLSDKIQKNYPTH